jgi:hypothetical protein
VDNRGKKSPLQARAVSIQFLVGHQHKKVDQTKNKCIQQQKPPATSLADREDPLLMPRQHLDGKNTKRDHKNNETGTKKAR